MTEKDIVNILKTKAKALNLGSDEKYNIAHWIVDVVKAAVKKEREEVMKAILARKECYFCDSNEAYAIDEVIRTLDLRDIDDAIKNIQEIQKELHVY